MDIYEEIARLAYDMYEREGRIHGKHLEHWIEAEIIVKQRYSETTEVEQEVPPEAAQPKKKPGSRSTAKKSDEKPKRGTAAKSKKSEEKPKKAGAARSKKPSE